MGVSIEKIDEVLEYFYEQPSFHGKHELRNYFLKKYEGKIVLGNDFTLVLDKLIKDGFIIQSKSNDIRMGSDIFEEGHPIFCISYEGILFYDSGGYKELGRRQKQDRENEEKKDALTNQHIQSSIDTNNSVIDANRISIDNIATQKNLTIASLIVAGASALFALASAYATLNDTTDEEVQLLRLQLQKQLQTQEKMQQSLKEIDSSIKIFVEYPHTKDTN